MSSMYRATFPSRTLSLLSLVACLASACAARTPREETLREDFDAARPGELPRGWRIEAGDWTVEEGELVGNGSEEEAWIELPGRRDDFRLEVTVRLPSAGRTGGRLAFTFGRTDEAGSVRHAVILAETDGEIRHVARLEGASSTRARGAAFRLPPAGFSGRVRLESGGGRVRLAIDGQPALDGFLAHDVEEGRIGLRLSGMRARFDDIEVSRLGARALDELRVETGPLRRVTIIAHRGASADAPENTLAALRLGVERGADAVEFDVYRSGDGALVLLHDETTLRTTDFSRVFPSRSKEDSRVSAMTLADLRKLDAGAWKGPRWAGERIPTLEEALRELGGHAIAVVEIKPGDIGAEVARAIDELGLESEVFIQSFSSRAVREAGEALPPAATGFLTGENEPIDPVARARDHLRRAREAGANAVVCDHLIASPEYVRELHRHAVSVWVYTVNDRAIMERLVRIGVDGIITDRPGRLRELLTRAAGPARGSTPR